MVPLGDEDGKLSGELQADIGELAGQELDGADQTWYDRRMVSVLKHLLYWLD